MKKETTPGPRIGLLFEPMILWGFGDFLMVVI